MIFDCMDTENDTLARLPAASVLWQSLRTTFALILREMGTTYGRSPGGYIWAIIEPIGIILILSVAFSVIVRSPSLGTSFVLFYATGYLPFIFYATTEDKITNALRFSRTLLAYPSVTWLDAVFARFTLNFLTSASTFSILMTGILALVSTRVSLVLVPIVTAVVLASLIGLGVGLVNCLLIGFFPIWKSVWNIISRPLFIVSGVFFVLEDMPPLVRDILWWNPLIHVIGLMRTGFYSTYHASYLSLPYAFGVALVLICIGLLFLSKYHKPLLER